MAEITALALPDEQQFIKDIQAINRFQNIVHANLIPNQDYGVIPGTQKPTLLKPGAEKIAKLLGLADQYEIVDRQEDWTKAFFRYLIRCKLVHVANQAIISEGLGECNSMESKYRYRWVPERDLPFGVDKTKLSSQERHTKTGGKWTVYRLDNEDIYSQVNTILKMAKKRALVDAALSAGRLSNVFTQDIEDLIETTGEVIEGGKAESKPPGKPAEPPKSSPAATPVASKVAESTQSPKNNIDMVWLEESMQKALKKAPESHKKLVAQLLQTVGKSKSVMEAVEKLTQEQAEQFTQSLNQILEIS